MPKAIGAGGAASEGLEWLDVVDAAGRPIRRERRETVHREGLWHATVHVWVLRPAPAGVGVVFQWRTDTRREFPNLLDVTCGGHVAAGEAPEHAMRRELREELGLSPRARVRALGPVPIAADGPGYQVREWSYEFIHMSRKPLTQYRVAAEEVKGLLAAPLSALKALWQGDAHRITMTGAEWVARRAQAVRREVTRDDFVPAEPEHWIAWADRVGAAADAAPPPPRSG